MSAPGPHPGRIRRLRAALRRRGLAAAVIGHLPNVRWLCGFSGSSGLLLVLPREAVLVSDFRYRAQARQEVRGARFVEHSEGVVAAAASIARAARVSRLGFEAERMTVAAHADLGAALPRVRLIPIRGAVEELRAVKEPGEVDSIRRCIDVARRAFAAATRTVVGATEIAVAERIRSGARRFGADDESFPTIVAGAERGALPHAQPTGMRISGGRMVVVDFGVRISGYCCDMTRTILHGKWDRRSDEIYRTVAAAQRAAIAAVRPGALAKDVDAAARRVIEDAGYGDSFGHGTGHGVGLEVHERPSISPRSGDVLRKGMVFTVEPGIYLEDFGGVRIEDMVLVTSKGCEVLSRGIPKQRPTREVRRRGLGR